MAAAADAPNRENGSQCEPNEELPIKPLKTKELPQEDREA
jgi:hypothetical protein